MAELSDLQKRFINEYLIDYNGGAAYQRAGYKAKGNAAEACASRLLRNAKVKELIEARQKKIAEKAEVTQEYVVRGLKEEAEWRGEGSSHSARVSAYAHLGKHLGMFTDKVELSGPNRGPLVKEITVVHHALPSEEQSPACGSNGRQSDDELPSGSDPSVEVNGKVPVAVGGDEIGEDIVLPLVAPSGNSEPWIR